MRVHQNQINPNAQLDAMYAAQKAAAKREAESTRKKLLEFASELSGDADSDACVVKLGPRGNSEEKPRQQNSEQSQHRRKRNQDASQNVNNSISDWA
jgi:hypothetical protein